MNAIKEDKRKTRVALILVTTYHFFLICLVKDRMSIVWFELPALGILAFIARNRRIDASLVLCFSVVCMFLLADPSVGFGYIIWLAIVPYFFVIDRENRLKVLAGWGLWTGTLIAAGTFSWIWRAITEFFELGAIASFPFFLVFILLMGVQHAIFLPLARFFRDRFKSPFLLIVPALYAVVEYWMPLPTPIALSVGLARQPFFLQSLDMVGMNGASLLIAILSGALYSGFQSFRLPKGRIPAAPIFIILLISGFHILYGFRGYSRFKDDPASPFVDIALIQPVAPLKVRNIDVLMQERISEKLKRLSLEAVRAKGKPPDLLIWPEGAGSFSSRFPEFNAPYMRAVIDIQNATSVTLFVQDVEFVRTPDSDRIRYFSAASLIQPVGNTIRNYRKNILMPFGEYLPLEDKFPILRRIFSEARTILPGEEATPISAPGGTIAALICYEVMFPDYVRKYVGRGCDYIVNLTNDRWYGTRQQPRQHLAMTAMRAIENRRPVARSTNSGITAFIDARGVIAPDMKTQTMEQCFLRGNLHPQKGRSFYNRHGDLLHRFILTPIILFLTLYAFMTSNACKGISGPEKKVPAYHREKSDSR